MLIKQKVCCYYLGRKVVFRSWILVVFVLSRVFVILFSVIKCQRWVDGCCSDMPRQVSLLLCWDVFVCRTFLGHNYLVEEKLKFK